MARIAFLGLGVMGFPMAGHLANAGHQVTVYNRTVEKAQTWLTQYTGSMAVTPAEAVEGAEFIMMCVGEDKDVREVIVGKEGIAKGASKGAVIIDHTTASAEVARDMYAYCKGRELEFMDAPVSGGQAGAENGQLTVMLGGDEQTFAKVAPVVGAYAKMAKRLGPVGSGQLAKMMNQICIAGVVQGLAEALHFGKNAGLDCADVVEVISQGAAQSWQMENRFQTMLNNEYEFGFAVDWMRKDLNIALQEARENGSHLAMTAMVDQLYSEVQALGGGRWDTSSLLARLENKKS